MSVEIRGGGSFQNSAKPWLTSQILVDINLEITEVLASPTIRPAAEELSVIRYERVINAEIQLIYIEENKVSDQLEKVLDTVTDGLALNWNPSQREGINLLPFSSAINPTNFQFALQIDSSQETRYMSVWIQSKKLKVEYAPQAFQRVKDYVVAALTS